MEGTNRPFLKAPASGTLRGPPRCPGRPRALGVGGSRTGTRRKKAWASFSRSRRNGGRAGRRWGREGVPPVGHPCSRLALPAAATARGRGRAPSTPARDPPPGSRCPHPPPAGPGPGRGRRHSCSGGGSAPPVTPAPPGMGVGSRSPQGAHLLRPAPSHPRTQRLRTHADRGACGRALGAAALTHIHARPQGPLGFGVTHGGRGTWGRAGRTYRRAAAAGRAGAPAERCPDGGRAPGAPRLMARSGRVLPPGGDRRRRWLLSHPSTASAARALLSGRRGLGSDLPAAKPRALGAPLRAARPARSPSGPPPTPRPRLLSPAPPPPLSRPRPLSPGPWRSRSGAVVGGHGLQAAAGRRGQERGESPRPMCLTEPPQARRRDLPGVEASPGAWSGGPGSVAGGGRWVACLVGPLGRGRPLVTVYRQRLLLP